MTGFSQRFIIIVLATLVVQITVPVNAADNTYAGMINKAGRQRMLSQRITRNYCLIGLDTMPERSRRQLENSMIVQDASEKLLQRLEQLTLIYQQLAES